MLQSGFQNAMVVVAALGTAVMSSSATREPKSRPTIEFSSATDDSGRTTVRIVLEGVPQDRLTPERLNALMGLLQSEEARAPRPVATESEEREERETAVESPRELREFQMELNLHWKRAGGPIDRKKSDPPKRPADRRSAITGHEADDDDAADRGVLGRKVDEAKAILRNLQGGPKDAGQMKGVLDRASQPRSGAPSTNVDGGKSATPR